MNSENEALMEEFRQSVMKEAYEGFIDWAWNKGEILNQYREYGKGGGKQNFTQWVTEAYWGEVG